MQIPVTQAPKDGFHSAARRALSILLPGGVPLSLLLSDDRVAASLLHRLTAWSKSVRQRVWGRSYEKSSAADAGRLSFTYAYRIKRMLVLSRGRCSKYSPLHGISHPLHSSTYETKQCLFEYNYVAKEI